MSIKKENSQMADKDGNPMIGNVQDAVADAGAAGGSYDPTEVNAIRTAVNGALAALRAHGLIKDS